MLKAKEYITAGDIIQVVGSQRFSTPVKASPLDIYRAVRSINPSPYMFLLELGGFSLVGASPEIHVRCEDGGWRSARLPAPAGAAPRPEEDTALEKELLADPKERAEHVMLVDLARNDLGRVCDFGTVQVKDLMMGAHFAVAVTPVFAGACARAGIIHRSQPGRGGFPVAGRPRSPGPPNHTS